MAKRDFARAGCAAALVLGSDVGVNAQTSTCHLSQVQVVQNVTTDIGGGGARPEILTIDDGFAILYRDTLVKPGGATSVDQLGKNAGGSFRLTMLDQNLLRTTTAKILIKSDSKEGVTDIRAVTDGRFVYAAYERASAAGRSLYAVKFDSGFREIDRRKIASAGLPGKGVEALDDPAPVLAAGHLYIITKTGHSADENQYLVRELTTDLESTGRVYTLGTGLDLGLGNVCSVISVDEHFYLVTTVHVSGKPLCPRSDATTNNDLVLVEYGSDWTATGFRKTIANAREVELYPTAFVRSGAAYYLAYQSFDPQREKKECGSSGESSTVTSVWLKVLNEKFNTVSQIRVTEDSETALHPTLQVIGNRILIAYGHRELPLSGSASRSNVWMRVFELACDERNERRAQSHESLDRR